ARSDNLKPPPIPLTALLKVSAWVPQPRCGNTSAGFLVPAPPLIDGGFQPCRSHRREPPGGKKAAPCGATLFKEAKWRESEETQFDAAPGSGTDRVRSREHLRVKMFQLVRPL